MADATIKILTNADLTAILPVLGSTVTQLADRYELTLPLGTDAGEADLIALVEMSIAASGNQAIDLDALTDIHGNAVDLAKLKAMVIYHDEDSEASAVTLTGDLLDTVFGSTFSMSLPVGDHLSFSRRSAGVTVSASSDAVTVTNNDAGEIATVKLLIFGTSA